MTETSAEEVCRLVVVGPTSRVDLSVPVHVPLADLLPTLLRSLGADLADRGLEHSGWVLQRLGEAPLDEDSTTEDLALVDGDVLHLRPRSEQIPPLDFDDLVDGVATGIGNRTGLWRPETTRLVSLFTFGFWILVALLVPLLDAPAGARLLTALGATVFLVAGTTGAQRILKDVAVARLAAAAAVLFAVETGYLLGVGYGPDSASSSGVVLVAMVGLGTATAIGVLLLVVERKALGPPVIGVVLVAVFGLVAAALRSSSDLPWVRIAAVLLVVIVVLRPMVPLISFKLAGLSLPELPVEPEDLQSDIDPEPGRALLAATAAADMFMTTLHLACGLVSMIVLVRLGSAPGTLVVIAALLGSVAQLLTIRPMTSTWHRLALGIPAAIGIAATLLALALRGQPDGGRPWVLSLILLLAAAAAGIAHIMPRRRLTPIWGRIGDWGQTLTVVALIPVIFGILGAYSWVRGMVG